MKFLIFFALAFATVSAKDLYSLSIEDPVLENESRITNGQTAAPSQFKYMVGLSLQVHSVVIWCGGSLIGAQWVLSAAHCTVAASGVMVYLGSTKRKLGGLVHNVSRCDIFTHSAYDASVLRADIALIRIPTTNESRTIGYVRTPRNNNDKYLGDSAFITGWGRTSNNGSLNDDLQYGILKVSPGNICFERFAHLFNDKQKICLVTPHKVSICRGDSGGPLVLEGKNLQIGVASMGGTEGCTEKEPIVFTRVSSYRLWITVRTSIR